MSRSSQVSQAPSLQELIRRRRAATFIGRKKELLLFEQNLATDPTDPAHWFLLRMFGPPGIGKTSLIEQWMRCVRERGGLAAYVDETPGDVVDTLASISEQMTAQGSPLRDFDKQLAAYRHRRQAAETTLTGADAGTPPSVGGALVGHAGAGILDLVIPGAGQLTSRVLPPDQLAQIVDGLRTALASRLRGAQDASLLADPAPALAPVFLRDLSAVARDVPHVTLFFDSYERTGPFLDTWLRDVVVGERYGALAANTLLCLSGQRAPDPLAWAGIEHFAKEVELQPFSEAEARQALVERGAMNDATVRSVIQLSGGLPVLVSMLALAGPVSPHDVFDPSGEAVDFFLRQVTDPDHRAAALAGALPLELDEDVLRAAISDSENTPTATYDWLRKLPFVRDQAGRAQYHEIVRSAMLRVQRRRAPQRWNAGHLRLAEHFSSRATAERGEAESTDGLFREYWYDKQWRDLRRQETYHRLCANPLGALPQALRNMACILHFGSSAVRNWSQMLERAATDCGREDTSLTTWAASLSAAVNEESDLPQLCDLLLTAPQLDKHARAMLLAARGHHTDQRGDLQAALRDLDLALETDPGCGDALYWRADARLRAHQFKGAHTDATVLLAHFPNHYYLLSLSCLARTGMEDYEGALDDARILLQRAPDDHLGLQVQAHAFTALMRFDEAFHAWDRLACIESDNPLAVLERGRHHYLLHRPEQALNDFDEAARRGEDSITLLQYRSCAYRELQRFGEALSCLAEARARESDADAATGVTALLTAKVYQHMGRPEDGLALLDRFIAEHPDHALMLRALTECLVDLGRCREAIAPGARLVVLAPQDGNAYLSKARAHVGAGQLTEARDDLERAVELSPTLARAHNELACVLAHMDAWQAAASSWSKALELEPGDYGAHIQRAYMRLLLGDYDVAREDLDTALSLVRNEDETFALGLRARCHRLLGEHSKAALDLDRLNRSGFTLLERALLRSRTQGLRRASHAWNTLSVQAIWFDGQGSVVNTVARLLAAAARADWDIADDLSHRVIAQAALSQPTEVPSLFGERGRPHLIEAARDLRFLAENPSSAARLERLAARLDRATHT